MVSFSSARLARNGRLLVCLGGVACSEYDFHGKDAPTQGESDEETAPALRVSPPAVDLGEVERGSTASAVVTLENVGTAPLDITDLVLASGVEWSMTHDAIGTLEAGESTDVALTFGPAGAGGWADTLTVRATDPRAPTTDVPLWAEVGEAGPGILSLTPTEWDFGVLGVGESGTARFVAENLGASPLLIDDIGFSANSAEMQLDPATTPGLPFTLGPADSFELWVHYNPVDGSADEGALRVHSTDGQEQQSDVFGNGIPFEGFSTGWYVWDPRVPVSTTTSADYVVDHHGDEDVYYYEPSGAHGMSGSSDVSGDFALLRDYVIANAGAPVLATGPFDWDETSTVTQFAQATFTYFLCDFYLPADADPSTYTIETGAVDDGIRVLVNGQILGHQKLGEGSGRWTLGGATPGAVNTLVIILVDDAAVNKYLHGLGFYHDGVFVEG